MMLFLDFDQLITISLVAFLITDEPQDMFLVSKIVLPLLGVLAGVPHRTHTLGMTPTLNNCVYCAKIKIKG